MDDFSKPRAKIILPKLSTHFRQFFVKVSKSYILPVRSCLDTFYRLLANFYWSHWTRDVRFFAIRLRPCSLFVTLNFNVAAVWPDVEIKSCPIFSKSCPKKSVQQLLLFGWRFSKLPKTSQNLLGYFCMGKILPRLLWIAQPIWSHWVCV